MLGLATTDSARAWHKCNCGSERSFPPLLSGEWHRVVEIRGLAIINND